MSENAATSSIYCMHPTTSLTPDFVVGHERLIKIKQRVQQLLTESAMHVRKQYQLTLELGQQLLGLGITGISRLLEHLTCQIFCPDVVPR